MNDKERQPTVRDMDTVRFISLVSMFASSAYMSMGKIANPATGKAERDLDAARGFIDILVMLKTRTEGNLTGEEEKMIASTISDLQLNFVREKEKPAPAPAPEEKPGEKQEPTAGKEKVDTGPIITPPPAPEGEKKKGKG